MAARNMDVFAKTRPLNWLARVWVSLTQPHASLTEIETRRQAQLLAALMLGISLLSLIVSFVIIFRTGRVAGTASMVWVASGLTLCLYALLRSGKYRLSAQLFIALNFVLIHGAPIFSRNIVWLFFTIALYLFAAALLHYRTAFALFVTSLILQVVIGTLFPLEIAMENLDIFLTVLVNGSLLFIYVNHRVGIEREKRDALRLANQKLRESELILEQRIEARTRELSAATQEAEAARLRAENADQVKSRFLASMSHELRTPLNAILNFNEFVALGMLGEVNERQKDALEKSLESGRHLLALINDVLDISKIEAGMMKLVIEDNVNLNELIASVSASALTFLNDKPVQFIMDIDEDLPYIQADRRRVRQVLLNLLSNACKFTQKGSVTLSVKDRGDHVMFAVIDTGPGVAKEDQALIFEPFKQATNGMQNSAGGTGLGLPISLWLVNAHHGRMWLESEPDDTGTSGAAFYFTLPLVQAMPLPTSTTPSTTETH